MYFLINLNEMFFRGMSVLWIVLKYDTLFSSSICWDEETSFEMFRMRFEDKTLEAEIQTIYQKHYSAHIIH